MRLLTFVFFAVASWAQSVESIPLRAVLSPGSEVPALELRAAGTSTIWLRVIRNASGRVTGGTVEFSIRYDLGSAAMLTGLHIHRGGAGVNGPVVLDSGLLAPVNVAAGVGRLLRQAPLIAAIAEEIVANPAAFYVNLHTEVNPGGAMRGQLIAADKLVFLTRVTPAGVVPPVTGLEAQGLAAVTLLGARDGEGRLTSAEIIFELDYSGFPGGTVFNGLHIHAGNREVRGPATIAAELALPAVPGAGGAGTLRYVAEVDLSNAGQFSTVTGLYQDPQQFYADLHTTANPAGAIRGQLDRADTASFSMTLAPGNEVPALDLQASAEAGFTVHVLRGVDGVPTAGMAEFDVHPLFAEDAAFTGLHVHNGRAGANGPVTIDSGIRTGASAAGNIFQRAPIYTPVALTALDSLLQNPEAHYVNLHTSANPGGAVRSQLAAAMTLAPGLTGALSAVWDPELRRVARGGLVTVFGSHLAKVGGMASGTGNPRVPSSLNGTTVTIGGRAAPILAVREDYVIAQVPNETAIGLQQLRVVTSNGNSNALSLTVDAAAPGIFFDAVTPQGKHAAVLKHDGLLRLTAVTPQNPARPGDALLFYGTGFGVAGERTPETGALAAGESGPRPVVTIGGRPAILIYSIFAPGLVGLNQVAVAMPQGAGTGAVPLRVQVGTAEANVVYLDAGP